MHWSDCTACHWKCERSPWILTEISELSVNEPRDMLESTAHTQRCDGMRHVILAMAMNAFWTLTSSIGLPVSSEQHSTLPFSLGQPSGVVTQARTVTWSSVVSFPYPQYKSHICFHFLHSLTLMWVKERQCPLHFPHEDIEQQVFSPLPEVTKLGPQVQVEPRVPLSQPRSFPLGDAVLLHEYK